MNDAARELRARLTDPRALAAVLGLTIARGGSVRQIHVCCPWHADRTPSCSVRLAKDGTIAVRCHACGATADALGLIAQVRGLESFGDVLREAAEIANAPGIVQALEHRPERTREPDEVSEEDYDAIARALLDACSPLVEIAPHVAHYLDGREVLSEAIAAGLRGLPADRHDLARHLLKTFDRQKLEQAGIVRRGLDALDWAAWCLVIPWRDRFGRISCLQRRRLEEGSPKYRFPPDRSPRAPFGVELLPEALATLGPGAEIVITEGALDALSRRRIARLRGEHAAVVGIFSASSPAVGLPLDLMKGRRVVIALDSDPPGEKACEVLACALSGVAADLVRERPRGVKDWNELLVRGAARGAA